jgi:hypothetical protein
LTSIGKFSKPSQICYSALKQFANNFFKTSLYNFNPTVHCLPEISGFPRPETPPFQGEIDNCREMWLNNISSVIVGNTDALALSGGRSYWFANKKRQA